MVPNDGGVDSVAATSEFWKRVTCCLIVPTAKSSLAKLASLSAHDSPVTFASYLVRMRPQPSHEPEYLNVALNDFSFISRARREAIPSLHSNPIKIQHAGMDAFTLPCPHGKSKEPSSVCYGRKLQDSDAAIARARRQIELAPRVPYESHRRRGDWQAGRARSGSPSARRKR